VYRQDVVLLHIDTDTAGMTYSNHLQDKLRKKKRLENVEYFNNLSSMIPKDVRYTCEMKFSIATVKAAFKKEANFFNSKLYFKIFRQEQAKCCIFERRFV